MITLKQSLARGFRRRCPQCGEGKLFASWGLLRKECEKCGLNLGSREENTWFFMYMSTAGITGIFILTMLLMTPPQHKWLAKIVVGVVSLAAFVFTHEPRKGMAIAFEYWLDGRLKKLEP